MFGLFKNKNKCQRFFAHNTKELNISGLTASLPKESGDFSASLGQLSIKPEYEKVSEKLQNLDLMQFTLCQEVKNLTEGDKKQEMISKIIETKLEIWKIAQNPKVYEESLKKIEVDNDRKIYEEYISIVIELMNTNNWKNWTSNIFHAGRLSCWETDIENMEAVASYILSRSYPDKYPNLKKALYNFMKVINDFIQVFKKYADISYHNGDKNQGYLATRKFYRIDEWNPERYSQLLKKYYYHANLLEDLMLEITRALNYIFELVKKNFNPKFRINEGLLLVELGPFEDMNYLVIKPQYKEEEKEYLYEGLKIFMKKRVDRDYHRGEGISEDYFLTLF